MICPVCKSDITNPLNQYGKFPVCQSCYLNGDDWVIDDPRILQLLSDGYELPEAMLIENDRLAKDLSEMFADFMRDVEIVKVHTK